MKKASTAKPRPVTAAGISVFLLEELGDARLRCVQLKKYIEEATSLIEKSDHRDHFFEVAGHLISGIPTTLLKMEKALDAAALAAARLDYEEIKDNLKPEKVEELEKALQDVRIRHVQRRSDDPTSSEEKSTAKQANVIHEAPPPAPAPPAVTDLSAGTTSTPPQQVPQKDSAKLQPQYNRREVERWMEHAVKHHVDHHTQEADATALAEEAAQHFNIYEDNRDYKIPEEIYDLALNVAEKEGFGIKLARKDEDMNPKLAAAHLNSIAQKVEATGRLPMDHVLHLIGLLETGHPKTASAPDPKKIAEHFKGLAAKVASGKDAEGRPLSRVSLARHLRSVYANEMAPTSAQMQAAIFQQANSREDVMEGFKRANPDMTEEDLEKAADMWEKHKDVVKDKNE